MTDLTLMERAAKAAGIAVRRGTGWQSDMLFIGDGAPNGWVTGREWAPLTDDGDALRLAVALRMNVVVKTLPHAVYVEAYNGQAPAVMETLADVRRKGFDPCAATRRAIVRAAAAMTVEGGKA